jgi:hypothetical protein
MISQGITLIRMALISMEAAMVKTESIPNQSRRRGAS